LAFHLLAGDQSADYLAQEVVVSIPTLRRYIADLRHMGCEIETARSHHTQMRGMAADLLR
jgi:predicted DNA-binding transcriptional regulator YafY